MKFVKYKFCKTMQCYATRVTLNISSRFPLSSHNYDGYKFTFPLHKSLLFQPLSSIMKVKIIWE